jgi:hypothetical protein
MVELGDTFAFEPLMERRRKPAAPRSVCEEGQGELRRA